MESSGPSTRLPDMPNPHLPPARSALLPEAVRAVDVIRSYDLLRVSTYRARPGNPDRIEIRGFGSAVATRFPAVGYFNQVYGLREEDLGRLPEIRAFYAEEGVGFKVHVAPDTERGRVFANLADDGFRMVEHLARYVAPAGGVRVRRSPERVRFEPLRPDGVDAFFRLYLTCFGAEPAGHAAAIANMRLLPSLRPVHCHVGRVGRTLAGICMLFVQGRTACLCAGATAQAMRGTGVQMAAIRHRARLARSMGCDRLVSWTEGGSYSGRNLERAGFKLVLLDPVWFLPPAAARAPGGVR